MAESSSCSSYDLNPAVLQGRPLESSNIIKDFKLVKLSTVVINSRSQSSSVFFATHFCLPCVQPENSTAFKYFLYHFLCCFPQTFLFRFGWWCGSCGSCCRGGCSAMLGRFWWEDFGVGNGFRGSCLAWRTCWPFRFWWGDYSVVG